MGASRTSNKDIADKLDTLIGILTAQAEQTQPVAASPTTEGGTVQVDEAYLECMTPKAAAHATDKGEETVLYARVNKAGETKLAYALRSRYDAVVAKQPSCKGAVATFQP
jgi:hypothetical protein